MAKDLLQEALDKFDVDYDYFKQEYIRAEDDIDFSLGNQWPDQIRAARQKEGRPCLTENRIDVSCIQTVNDIRQTRPAINVTPQDDKADVDTARVLKGIIRNIEQQSNANNAYDQAAENSVRGGYGWLRIGTRYVSHESFDQEAYIEGVENPFSCLIDAHAKKLDGSDAEHGWAFIDMPRDQFTAEYPEADPCSFDTGLFERGWLDEDTVRVAEFFYKDKKKYTLVRTQFGDMDKKDADKAGIPYTKERETFKEVVKWCKLTCNEILEETDWPGKYIPIVPVYGKVVWNEGRRKSFSLTYQGRDPQMRYNFQITAETEYTALQPKAPWLVAEGQIVGYENLYSTANIKNHAYLPYRLQDFKGNLVPPPSRQAPPSGSPAMMQQALVAADGIKATLGIYDASLGKQGNETSGRAILARQQEGDNATFHFVDNLSTSIRHVGRILVDLIPKLYSGPTVARILGDDGEPAMVPLNQPVIKQGKQFLKPDPAMIGDSKLMMIRPDAGSYDVAVTIGPSFASKRQELTYTLMELYKMNPAMFQATADIYFKNSDFEGAQELAERAKKMVPPELRDESPEQAALMQAQQQLQQMGTALEQLQGQLKQKQDNQAESNALENKKIDLTHQIDQQKLELDREKLALEALKAQSEITPQQLNAFLMAVTEIDANLKDVGQAVATILDGLEADIPQSAPPVEVEQPMENVVV